MENKKEKIKTIKEIEIEGVLYLCKIDNNSKIAIGMAGNKLSIYKSDISTKLATINDIPSYFLYELPEKTNRNGIKLLCCSYSYQIKMYELLFRENHKFEYNILYTIEPNESRKEISKAIELNNEKKNIASIDEYNIIIYELLTTNKYIEIKKIPAKGVNDILNINEKIFCVSLPNKGIIQFYDSDTFELISEIKKIECYGCNNYNSLCKLNDDILCVGGFEYISLLDINLKQLNNKIHLIKNKERITSTCWILEKKWLITGTKYKKDDNEYEYEHDIIVYKLNNDNILEEIKRFQNTHSLIIYSIIYINGNIISCSQDNKIKIWPLLDN